MDSFILSILNRAEIKGSAETWPRGRARAHGREGHDAIHRQSPLGRIQVGWIFRHGKRLTHR